MEKNEFYNTLEIEKTTESMRQHPLSGILHRSPEQPRNRAIPWMRHILEGSGKQEEIDRLCELEIDTVNIPWSELTEQELWYIFSARPDFMAACPMHILHALPETVWFSLLLGAPELVVHCPCINRFDDITWNLLVGRALQLSHWRPYSKTLPGIGD